MPPASMLNVPVVRRRELPHPPVLAAPIANARALELIGPARGYDPPHAGEDTPARPARMPVHVSLAINAIQAVMFDRFYIRGEAPPPQVAQPKGRMTAFRQRANIRSPRPQAYGSQFAYVAEPVGAYGAIPLAGMP